MSCSLLVEIFPVKHRGRLVTAGLEPERGEESFVF